METMFSFDLELDMLSVLKSGESLTALISNYGHRTGALIGIESL
jgi:hypothetical protein